MAAAADHIEWVRMSSAAARKLAAMLTEEANELDRLPSARKRRRRAPPRHPCPECPESKIARSAFARSRGGAGLRSIVKIASPQKPPHSTLNREFSLPRRRVSL
jgi:hypothetical protein